MEKTLSQPIPSIPSSHDEGMTHLFRIADQSPANLSKIYFKYSYTNLEQTLKPLLEIKRGGRTRPQSIKKGSSSIISSSNSEAPTTIRSSSKEEESKAIEEKPAGHLKASEGVFPVLDAEKVKNEFQSLLKKKYMTRSKYTFHDKIPLFNKKAYLLKLGCSYSPFF